MIKKFLNSFRERLTKYRSYKVGKDTSIHINALEMALCLVEFAYYSNRSIKNDEIRWFEADWELTHVLENSPWEDLLDYYLELKKIAVNNNFFESLDERSLSK